MIRAQCIVQRGNKLLMVKHRVDGVEWWCLPGGGVEQGETAEQAAIRELTEECGVTGTLVRQTSRAVDDESTDTITYLADIGTQEPHLGADPELGENQILADMRWMTLAEVCERDRAFLWAAGLLSVSPFTDEVFAWGDELSYPGS
jgi:8-oxo-dGTP diphosphatase